MRICRYRHNGTVAVGLYHESYIIPLTAAAVARTDLTAEGIGLPQSNELMDFLPPDGPGFVAARKVAAWLEMRGNKPPTGMSLETSVVELLVPIPRPNKLFLLAGNYAAHIQEGGGAAPERAETFPYVFMKPPSTTLTDPGKPIIVPKVSPAHVDWELELVIVIGRKAKHVAEKDALKYVAGYTVINDISDRKFRPNPGRKLRDKDSFFDWQHGKWHDSFCPCGPCVTTADAIPDPQRLPMKLSVNGTVRQNASTGQQIFPVAAVVEFLSHICTLEPGDLISTGTPAGVGNSTGTYLHAGDKVEAWIDQIGTLVSSVIDEPAA